MSGRVVAAGGLLAMMLAAGGARADAKSDALFAKAREVVARARGFQADQVVTISADGKSDSRTSTLRALKPNLWEVRTPTGENRLKLSDGKHRYSTFEKGKQYFVVDPTPPEHLAQDFGLVLGAFMGASVLPEAGQSTYAGQEKVDGKTYEVAHITLRDPQGISPGYKLYFGASGLPEGREWDPSTMDGPKFILREWLKNLKLDPPLTPASFEFHPPKGYTAVIATSPGK